MTAASKVGVTSVTAPTDREVVISRVFDAPRKLVFDAHTKCDHIRNWMLGPGGWTMPICQLELRPGGVTRFVWRKGDGAEMEIRGEVKEVSPPERFVATESWGPEWPKTLNTLVLTEEDGKTKLTLTLLYPTKEARDAALQTDMEHGASDSYNRLDEYLRTVT